MNEKEKHEENFATEDERERGTHSERVKVCTDEWFKEGKSGPIHLKLFSLSLFKNFSVILSLSLSLSFLCFLPSQFSVKEEKENQICYVALRVKHRIGFSERIVFL